MKSISLFAPAKTKDDIQNSVKNNLRAVDCKRIWENMKSSITICMEYISKEEELSDYGFDQ
jgi:hypothetical protein